MPAVAPTSQQMEVARGLVLRQKQDLTQNLLPAPTEALERGLTPQVAPWTQPALMRQMQTSEGQQLWQQ